MCWVEMSLEGAVNKNGVVSVFEKEEDEGIILNWSDTKKHFCLHCNFNLKASWFSSSY